MTENVNELAQARDRIQALERNLAAHRAVIDGIRAMLDGTTAARALRGRRPKEFGTAYGRLIAAAAKEKGVALGQLGKDLGYSGGYVPRVASGEFVFTLRAALAIGQALGLNLAQYVGQGGKQEVVVALEQGPEQAQPELGTPEEVLARIQRRLAAESQAQPRLAGVAP